MILDPIRTHHRLGQWNRWQVYASVVPRHIKKRMFAQRRRYPTATLDQRSPRDNNVRHVGTVYAESRAHATQLAKQALNTTVRSVDRIIKLAKLTANPPTEGEFQAWLRQIGNGSKRPTCGPLIDDQGYAIACFVPC